MEGKDSSKGYDRLKQYKGGGYSGMKIGASHKWYYDQGEWRERKLTPDEWNIYYQTTKRRAGKAPVGSGAPTGTEYNWLIVAHQRVDKLDANSYMTCLEGKKFKVAHKRASLGRWNKAEKAQRREVIKYLEQVIRELKEAGEDEQLPYTVGEEDRIYGLEHRTREELYELASEWEIPGRSGMKRGELLEAVKERLYGKPAGEGDGADAKAGLRELSKDDLYRMAGKHDISGRSDMNKAELVQALRHDMSRLQPSA